MEESIHTHGVTIVHKGDVPLGLHHIRYMEQDKMHGLLKQSREAGQQFGHHFNASIGGGNRNYILKHVGYDKDELIPRPN